MNPNEMKTNPYTYQPKIGWTPILIVLALLLGMVLSPLAFLVSDGQDGAKSVASQILP